MTESKLEQALKRPMDYHQMEPMDQWGEDSRLGILDWRPTHDEIREYLRRRIEMGDWLIEASR